MLNCLMRFIRHTDGAVVMIFGLMLLPLISFTGVAIDYSSALSVRTTLQTAVDAGALAGASLDTTNNSERVNMAETVFGANATDLRPGSSVAPSVSVYEDKVTVSASVNVPTYLLGAMGVDMVTVAVNATAIRQEGAPICILSLNATADDAISFQGTTSLVSPDCAVQANSDHSSALHSQGNASPTAVDFCAVGGYTGSNFSPQPKSGCPKVEDPYENLTPPSTAGCDYNLGQIKNPITLSPGIYCGGLNIKSDVTFLQGIYVIKDGEFTVMAQGTATGAGVMFYLTGNNAGLNIQSNGFVTLSAPTTGPYAGLVFFQDPTSNPGHESDIQGGGTLDFDGAIYLPTQTLDIGGGGVIGGNSSKFSIIADKVLVRGNGQIHLSADATSPKLLAGARLIY